ncbi:unnamed protein product [Mesocestoides corti]|uniref:2-phosphosulfolactate phosphatase n=1 Tax=Mesocestoides corti TaxID=53468 RepID=A0A0R3UD00_MESCO|nr:unnamed protein product [Mesocestoides corti]
MSPTVVTTENACLSGLESRDSVLNDKAIQARSRPFEVSAVVNLIAIETPVGTQTLVHDIPALEMVFTALNL